MEILKGFEFQIQRFADLSVAAATGVDDGNDVWYDSTSETWKKTNELATTGMTITGHFNSGTANTLDVAAGTTVVAAAGTIVKVKSGFTVGTAGTAPTLSDAAGNVTVGDVTVNIPSTETITFGDATGTISNASGTKIYAVSGDLVLAATVTKAVDLTTNSGTNTPSVTYTKGTALNSTTVTTSAGDIALTETDADSDKTDTKVTKAGVLTGLDSAGTAVLDTVTVTASADNSGATFVKTDANAGTTVGVTAVTGSGKVVSTGAATLTANVVSSGAAQITFESSALKSVNAGTFATLPASTKIDTSVAGSGNVVVDALTFAGDGTTATIALDAVGTYTSQTSVALTKGKVINANTSGEFKFNDNTYTLEAATTFGVSTANHDGIESGKVSGVSSDLYVLDTDLSEAEQVSVLTNVNGVTVEDSTNKAVVSGLDSGERVRITDKDGNYTVWEATGTTVKAQKYNKNGTTNGDAVFYSGLTSDDTFMADGTYTGLTPIPTGDIRLSEISTKKFYTADGASVDEGTDGIVATVDGTASTKSVAITGSVNKNIYLDEASTVTDSTGTASFFIKRNNRETTKVNAKGFDVSSEGVISNATGTVTLLAGTDLALSGTVNVDVTAKATAASATTTTAVATYVAGASVNGAKIKLDDTRTLTLTEATNSNDTVIYDGGSIAGLDAGAVVTGAEAGTKITTTGSETAANTYTINKKTITVTGDDSVDITVTNDDVVTSTIENLAVDATLDMAASFSEYANTITVNGTTFTTVTSKDGLTFVGASGNKATVTLNAKGEKVTTGGYTYELKSSNSTGVTIESASGRVTGLSNGDTLVITNVANNDTLTLTANNNGLVVDYVDYDTAANNNSTTYSLDSGETSFTAKIGTFATSQKAGVAVDGGTAGEAIGGFTLTTGSGTASVISSVTNGMWLDKDNNILADNSSNKAVAQMSATDSTITYTEIGDKSQTLNITDTTHDWNIVTNGGKDDITFNTTSEGTISSGAGSDTVRISGNGVASVNAGDGDDEITIATTAAGDDTIVTGNGKDSVYANGTGDVVIDGRGTGNKLLSHAGAASGDATLYGGDGDDTIRARSMDDSVVGGAGKDVFAAVNSMKISDYQFGTDIVSIGSAFSNTALNWGTDGVVSMSSGVQVDVSAGTGTGSYYAVTAKDSAGASMTVGWTGDNGGNIDASSVDKAVVLIGNHNEEGKDLLVGSAKGDSLYGGTGDSVYGGAGKDTVSFATSVTGAYVGVASTSGKDEVYGFKGGFDATEADSIYLVDGDSSSVKVSVDGSNNITFKNGDGSLLLSSVAKDTTGSGAYQLLVSGQKVYTVAEGGTVSLTGDNYGDYYIATKNGIADLSKVESNVTVDLADTDHIRNFNQIKGGAGNTTLMGSGVNSTLTAGTGNTSLWGGAGKDSLVGGTSADMFVFMNGDGSDTVSGFSAGTSETSDTLNLWTSNLAGVSRDTNTVKVTVEAGDVLTVTGTSNVNDKIQWKNETGAKGVAKIGVKGANNTFSYEEGVTNYIGGTGTDVVSLTGADDVNVWLDGSQGASYAGINAINASGSTGNLQLAGDTASQSIVGGRGDTSLWGGAGKTADTLTGGNGVNTFFYGAGEGNDVIVSASADDSVNLYNLKLSDVDVANSSITNSGVSLALNDGSKLTVQTSRDMTFSIDGQSWTAQHSSKEWKQNS